eukprot:376471-Pyramimonas_sp.AAC.1
MATLVGYRGNIPSYGYVGWLPREYTFVWQFTHINLGVCYLCSAHRMPSLVPVTLIIDGYAIRIRIARYERVHTLRWERLVWVVRRFSSGCESGTE